MEGNGGVSIYNGNYSEYRISLDNGKDNPAPKKTVIEEDKNNTVPKKLSFKEQKELDEIEETVAEKENEIEDLTKLLNAIDATDYVRIQEASEGIAKLNKELESIMERWVELSDKTN
ncbi:ABC transporter C-terminal domain-containing protein [Pedobacter polaris]